MTFQMLYIWWQGQINHQLPKYSLRTKDTQHVAEANELDLRWAPSRKIQMVLAVLIRIIACNQQYMKLLFSQNAMNNLKQILSSSSIIVESVAACRHAGSTFCDTIPSIS